jgi:3-oxoacyl-[acyl-carrier-protein] synthase II
VNRVVITGAGAVSPLGSGKEEFFAGLRAGFRGIDHIRSFDTRHFPSALGAEARAGGEVIPSAGDCDRKAMFMNSALQELFRDSDITSYEPRARLLHLGVGIDYFDLPGYVERPAEEHWTRFSARASRAVEGFAQKFALSGGHGANVSACVASTQAMGWALRKLRREPDKAVVTGGFDSMLSHLHYMGFYNLGALADWGGEPAGACRPFDRHRCGLVIGEGAVAYLFENARCADPERILCEIAGYGSTMDAYMVTDPEPSGRMLAEAARQAIADAGITPHEIDSLDLHGTGTVKNALAEVRALELVFGERYREIPAFALKGQIGHLIGACGAMEVLGVIDALQRQRLLPSANCEEADPEIPLKLIRGEPYPMQIRYVLKLNAAFGGQNTALVLKKYEQ